MAAGSDRGLDPGIGSDRKSGSDRSSGTGCGSGSGSAGSVLVVVATHGNERCAPWLLEQWRRTPAALASTGVPLELVIGNPEAYAANRRYQQCDLNRCFVPDRLADAAQQELEMGRARQLLSRFGPGGERPCWAAFDLHSTTSAMGNSLVVYGRRPADLALAAAIQADLGLPVYLHEGDARQTGFLVERWPCGLVIEVGPVAQGLVDPRIARCSQLALESGLQALGAAGRGELRLPRWLVVHRHRGSLDRPRPTDGGPAAALVPERLGRDWQPLRPGDPLFLTASGETIPYEPPAALAGETVWPVFINEAAYGEKGIALSLTSRERWSVEPAWGEALSALAQRGAPL